MVGTGVMVATSLLLPQLFNISDQIAMVFGILFAVINNFSWHYFTTWKERIQQRSFKDYFSRLIHYKIYTLPIDLIVIVNFAEYLKNNFQFFSDNKALAMVLATVPCAIIKFILNDILVFRMKKRKEKETKE